MTRWRLHQYTGLTLLFISILFPTVTGSMSSSALPQLMPCRGVADPSLTQSQYKVSALSQTRGLLGREGLCGAKPCELESAPDSSSRALIFVPTETHFSRNFNRCPIFPPSIFSPKVRNNLQPLQHTAAVTDRQQFTFPYERH